MPLRRTAPSQPDLVSQRLSLLGAELAAARSTDLSDELAVEMDASAPLDPSLLPSPGRHASRTGQQTTARLLAERMPETMRGRIRLTPLQLSLVVLLVVAGLALAGWWTLRTGASREPVLPGPVGVSSTTPATTPALVSPAAGVGAATPSPSASATTKVVVDVSGAVRRPGIVVLTAGARVVDALSAAGGARAGVDLSALNQARLLVDGEQILVGRSAPPGTTSATAPPSTIPTGGGTEPGAALININTATEPELEELPGVGPVTAAAIIEWRTTNGAFTSVDELLDIDGIGDKTLADLVPHVTV